jgi:hypothetical protein
MIVLGMNEYQIMGLLIYVMVGAGISGMFFGIIYYLSRFVW